MKKEELLEGIDQFFDIFYINSSQKRKMEMKNKLLMTKKDFDFYNDQEGPRLGKCLKTVERLPKRIYCLKDVAK